MWKQPPIVGTHRAKVAKEAAKQFKLPRHAEKWQNWKRVEGTMFSPNKVWRYKTQDVPHSDEHQGKHYIYQRNTDNP